MSRVKVNIQPKTQFEITAKNVELYPAIFYFVFVVYFGLIAIGGEKYQINGDVHRNFYDYIFITVITGLLLLFTLYKRYNKRILISDNRIKLKCIFKKTIVIFIKNIESVSLEEDRSRILINDVNKTIIAVPLKFKGWEKLVELLEDSLEDEKFHNFE